MFKNLALWYLTRRARKLKDFYNREMASWTLNEINDPDNRWLFEHMSEYHANNTHALRSLEAIKKMEGT